MNLDIDELRVRLGGWDGNPESKRVARSLGFGLALQHLQAGHDVVLPQLLLLGDVVEDVGLIATQAGAEFIEVVLLASPAELMTRIRESHSPGSHPRNVFTVDELEPRVADSIRLLNELAAARPSALLVDVGELAPEPAAERVRSVIGWVGS